MPIVSGSFKCPNCGGYKFGTSAPAAKGTWVDNKDQWTGHCHGSDTHPSCGFTWNRMLDDEKVMTAPEVIPVHEEEEIPL